MKMLHHSYAKILSLSLLFILSGCGKRFEKWGKETFKQADEVKVNTPIEVARKNVKTLRLYDEFATLGIFDVMWLSDDVRRAYVMLYTTKQGLDAPTSQSLERRELAINDHLISFYVLAYQPYEPKLQLLGNTESNWSIYLKIGDKKYPTSSIKVVDISPEYRAFFGKRFNRYQTPYQVSFDAHEIDGTALIKDATTEFTLCISTTQKMGELSWPIRRTPAKLQAGLK